MKLEKYEVGKLFPGPIPEQEGTNREIQAFKISFQRYSYFETNTPVPIAVWVFDFPKPFGQIDVNFNGKLVPPEYIKDYFTLENGQVKNLLTFFLLDGQILRGIKAFGLEPEAVKLFHTTIRKQIELEILWGEEAFISPSPLQVKAAKRFLKSTIINHK